ncbi:phosphodiester glycosidase family protein [Candidatus Saganbacteria bacterium]|nr:phosphodiester glycosidase family protein [Candidatus Saganbacteria bacterium]
MICLFLGVTAQAATLNQIRVGQYPEKIRVVFDFDSMIDYESDEQPTKIILRLKSAAAGPAIKNYLDVNDLVLLYIEVEKDANDLKIVIPLSQAAKYSVFAIGDPPRLVIDFNRDFLNISSSGTIADGIEYLTVKKGLTNGQATAKALRLDLGKVLVRPALAQKPLPNLLEAIANIFTAWKEKKSSRLLQLAKVSQIVKDNNAIAGINASYFASTGRPLGALIIDREPLSFSINDRTAFFLDECNRPYIDNLTIAAYFDLVNGTRFSLTGMNQQRGEKDVIMYTPAWGETTGTNNFGIEIIVSNQKIIGIKAGNAKIPEDGYVLSVVGPGVEALPDSAKVGDQVITKVQILPYSANPNKIIHLVSGGPRLLKNGQLYISKYEEKFRSDIASGRAARTAVGITNQGQLLLVTVDGLIRHRKKDKDQIASVGVTLEELADLMLNLGASEALNLDGGSSSTMVINDTIVNNPTAGYQRSVNNALIVEPRD